MKKRVLFVLVFLSLSFSLYATESYLSVNYTPMFSSVATTLENEASRVKAVTSLVEIAGARYWGHSGFVVKARCGRIIKINDVSVDNSPIGYNSAFGYSYITSPGDKIDFVADLLFMYAYDRTSGYVYGGGSYTIHTFIGEFHSALQLRMHLSTVTMLNLGFDAGIPLFSCIKGAGYYNGQSLYPKITGFRVAPFAGISIRVL